jgi:hypothetical protein
MKKVSPFVVTNVTRNIYQTGTSSSVSRSKKTRLYVTTSNLIKPKNTIEMISLRNLRFSRLDCAMIKSALIDFVNKNFHLDSEENPLTEHDVSLKWSRYAGCSCPCSPGYIVDFTVGSFFSKFRSNEDYRNVTTQRVCYNVELGFASAQSTETAK